MGQKAGDDVLSLTTAVSSEGMARCNASELNSATLYRHNEDFVSFAWRGVRDSRQ